MDSSEYIINNWLLDIASGSLIHQTTGEQRRLGEYQLRLLTIFIQNAGKILSREELTNLVWERRIIGNNSLPNAVHALRAALEDDGKQQRLIKTIPRKGYILEAEFCGQRHVETDNPPEESDVFPARPECDAGQPADLVLTETPQPENNAAPPQPGISHWVKKKGLSTALFILALVIAFSSWGWKNSQQPPTSPFSLSAVQRNVYSNIALYQLNDTSGFSDSKDDLHASLKGSLYRMNQTLKTHQVHLQIYYHASEMVLNYTMVMKNSCDKRQLAMNIYQWRQDIDQLNSLIYREMERKLNEMAVCIN
ncbi:Transcriptional regulator [Paramixta manurensis]|uniref:Transcriptional regulator n=1 Tax=Paramixta manurensis TaxID=2740817 RepID=A0A6M8UJK9_9GAMM|nr:Transcriptional regulator [Erwiniaceae bacterium PD-1]